MARCDVHAATGGRCVLDANHDGAHEAIAYPYDAEPRRYSFTDDSKREFINQESRKPLGT